MDRQGGVVAFLWERKKSLSRKVGDLDPAR